MSKALDRLRKREAAEKMADLVLWYWKLKKVPEAEQLRRIRAMGRKVREMLPHQSPDTSHQSQE